MNLEQEFINLLTTLPEGDIYFDGSVSLACGCCSEPKRFYISMESRQRLSPYELLNQFEGEVGYLNHASEGNIKHESTTDTPLEEHYGDFTTKQHNIIFYLDMRYKDE